MRISVVIPAYNRESLILPTLESVRQQSLAPAEVLIVDDCSTDQTVEVVKRYGAEHRDFPMRLVVQDRNQGVSAARNRGIREASGDWVAFLDSDDLWELDHLAALANLAREPEMDVVFSRVRGFSLTDPEAASRTWTSRFETTDEVLKEMVSACHILPSAAMVRKEMLLEHGGFDETSDIQHAEDWDLWLRMIVAGANFALADAFTCLYRQHEGSACRDKSRLYRAILYCLRKNAGNLPWSAAEWRNSLGYYGGKLGQALLVAGQPGAPSALWHAWWTVPGRLGMLVAALLSVGPTLLPALRPAVLRINQRLV